MEKLRRFGEMFLKLPCTCKSPGVLGELPDEYNAPDHGPHVRGEVQSRAVTEPTEEMDGSPRNLEDRFRGLAD